MTTIKLILVGLFVIPSLTLADGITKNETNCKEIQDGSICYDLKSQTELDEALELGVECQRNIQACRKWRDKYKALLSQEQVTTLDESQVKYTEYKEVHKWTQNTWLKFGVATALAFGLGLSVGVAF